MTGVEWGVVGFSVITILVCIWIFGYLACQNRATRKLLEELDRYEAHLHKRDGLR